MLTRFVAVVGLFLVASSPRVLTQQPVPPGPGQAHSLVGLVANNNITLTWQAPAAPAQPVLGYRLDVGLTPGATLVSLPLGNVQTFSVVAPDGVFFVRVQAVNASGPTGASNEVRLVVGQALLPAAPSLQASVNGNQVALQWTPNPAGGTVAGYRLAVGSGPGLSNIATVPLPATVQSLTSPAPAGTYFIRVHGVNASGIGPASNEAQVTIQTASCVPGPPSGLVANVSPGGVALSWNAPATGGAPTGYQLSVGSSAGSSNIGTFPVPLTTTVASAAPGGTYFVRVAALNGCGASPNSNEVSFVVSAPQPTAYIGTWDGVVVNHPGSFGHGPITSFVMTLTKNPVLNGNTSGGSWQDNLGCRNNNVVPFISRTGVVVISVESLACNDGDFSMTVTSAAGNVVEGTCRGNCRFRMTKR